MSAASGGKRGRSNVQRKGFEAAKSPLQMQAASRAQAGRQADGGVAVASAQQACCGQWPQFIAAAPNQSTPTKHALGTRQARSVCSTAVLTSPSVLMLPWRDSSDTAARQKTTLRRMTLQVSTRACRLVATCGGQQDRCSPTVIGGNKRDSNVTTMTLQVSEQPGPPLGGHLCGRRQGEAPHRAGRAAAG